MDHYNEELFNSLINLDTFSRIMPNTDIHMSRSGYFVPTAGKLSSIIGAQTISNFFNGYTPIKLALELKFFSSKFVNLLYDMCRYADDNQGYKIDVMFKIQFVKKEYQIAYGNDKQGLVCLLKTYEGTDIYDSLFKSVGYISENLEYLESYVHKWGLSVDEYQFNDQDWELYMRNSDKLQYETTGFYKFYVMYYGSFMYNNFMNNIGIWNWYNKIYVTNNVSIYLGAMPLKVTLVGNELRNDATLLKSIGVGAVLSVVECYENQSNGIVFSPIKPNEWEAVGIKYLQVPIPDFSSVDLTKINTCVEFIQWNVLNGVSVYTSCRAGKNRSTLIIMCYLIKYHSFTSDNVYEYVKSIRPQVQNKHHDVLLLFEQSLHNDF